MSTEMVRDDKDEIEQAIEGLIAIIGDYWSFDERQNIVDIAYSCALSNSQLAAITRMHKGELSVKPDMKPVQD